MPLSIPLLGFTIAPRLSPIAAPAPAHAEPRLHVRRQHFTLRRPPAARATQRIDRLLPYRRQTPDAAATALSNAVSPLDAVLLSGIF